ncbi:hypothetical protein [Actinoplanes sp. GCM10030250]|uniref:hypothetical protein n=1 Tax=Actinoplanes sp. GCM10030250 TaxID=3273376 RepID=UPI00361AF986
MGLFLIVLMCIATVLLIRNMNKRIRRLPDSFSDAKQRDGVADIARLDTDADRSRAAASADVEKNRSVQAAGGADAQDGAVTDGKDSSAAGGGTSKD